MRHVLTGAALLLVVGTSAACGGSDAGSAPDNASKEDFCEAYVGFYELEDDATGKDLHDYADELEDTGTPDDMSDEEREGFEVYIDAINDVDEDEKVEDMDDPDVSKSDEEKGKAFSEYANEKCKDEINEAVGVPSTDDLPTDPGDIETDEIPTDGASDVPIDPDEVPTDPEELESYLDQLESEMADMSESP